MKHLIAAIALLLAGCGPAFQSFDWGEYGGATATGAGGALAAFGGVGNAVGAAGTENDSGANGGAVSAGSAGESPADAGEAGADPGDAGAACTPLSCTAANGSLRCGVLRDACGGSLDCGIACGGQGSCGTARDPYLCNCGACGVCPAGEVWAPTAGPDGPACCRPRTCLQDPAVDAPLCGDVPDGCSGLLHCPPRCVVGTCDAGVCN